MTALGTDVITWGNILALSARFDVQTFYAGNVTEDQFCSAGTPRGIWVRVRHDLGKPQ